jgi:hypothetical protein
MSTAWQRGILLLRGVGLLAIGLCIPSIGRILAVAVSAMVSAWEPDPHVTYGNFDLFTRMLAAIISQEGFVPELLSAAWWLAVLSVGVWLLRAPPLFLVTRLARCFS